MLAWGHALARGGTLARGHGDTRLREGTRWQVDTWAREAAFRVAGGGLRWRVAGNFGLEARWLG